MLRFYLLLILFFYFISAQAAERIDTWPKINPKLGLQVVADPAAAPGEMRYKNSESEVWVTVTSGMGRETGARAAAIQIDRIRMLYAPRRSPYTGEISDLIQCDQKQKPSVVKLKIMDQATQMVIGGVNARNMFGACVSQDIAKQGVFLAFYEPSHRSLVEVRLFTKKNLSKTQLTQLAEDLFKL